VLLRAALPDSVMHAQPLLHGARSLEAEVCGEIFYGFWTLICCTPIRIDRNMADNSGNAVRRRPKQSMVKITSG